MPTQFEMLELGMEGLESLGEAKKELAKFDELRDEYKAKSEKIIHSKAYRLAGTTEWYILNSKDNMLYKRDNSSIKEPITPKNHQRIKNIEKDMPPATETGDRQGVPF